MNNRTASRPLKLTEITRFLAWGLIVFLAWYFMHGADHFLSLTPAALGKYFDLRWVLIAHITAGGGALVLGPFQFFERFRNNHWRLHRVIGILYLLAILMSGICAVIMAFTTAYQVNWPYALSLQVWVSVWISSSFIAYRSAIKKRFRQHREWMTRSYIVTIAFVLSGLAVKLPVIQQLGSFAEISPSLFWFAWAVPLYIYEIALSSVKKA